MKLNERYEIRVVVVEYNDGIYGDVYDNFKEFKKDKPTSGYKFGFIVFDTEYGFIPDNCNDWNDSVEEALLDWQYNC